MTQNEEAGTGGSVKVVIATLAVCTIVGSCSTAEAPSGRSPSSVQASATPTQASSPSPVVPGSSRAVRFQAADGVRLEGRLFGTGRVGVVLSHMGRTGDDQSGWFPAASFLADRGYFVLTYNRRGVCPGGELGCSGGHDSLADHWKDVLGALAFLRERVRTVFLGGASIGAMATFFAVERPGPRSAG